MLAAQASSGGVTADAVIDLVIDGVAMLDSEAKVVRANRAFCDLLARGENEILGNRVTAFLTPPWQAVFGTRFAARKNGDGTPYAIAFARPDGSAVNTVVYPLPLKDPNGRFQGSLAIIHDRSDSERLNDALATRDRIVESSGIIVYRARLAPDFPVEDVSDSVRQLGYEAADIIAGRMKLQDIVPPEDFSRIVAEIDRHIASGQGQFVQHYRVKTRDGGIRHVEDQVTVRRSEGDGPTYLEGVLRDITAQVEGEHRHYDALAQVVRALAAAIETRDPYTAGHQHRVANLALAIGRKLGIAGHELEGLYLGALIHDVGKLAVPTEILTWPGKVSEAKHVILREHCNIGRKILGNFDFPWPIGAMIEQHHERLDGSGYPRGLMGEQIIREARIIAVADVFEAMSSHRPYRAASGLEAALDELTTHKGTAFDAEIVAACVAVVQAHGNGAETLWRALAAAAGDEHISGIFFVSTFDDDRD